MQKRRLHKAGHQRTSDEGRSSSEHPQNIVSHDTLSDCHQYSWWVPWSSRFVGICRCAADLNWQHSKAVCSSGSARVVPDRAHALAVKPYAPAVAAELRCRWPQWSAVIFSSVLLNTLIKYLPWRCIIKYLPWCCIIKYLPWHCNASQSIFIFSPVTATSIVLCETVTYVCSLSWCVSAA